MTAKEVRFSSDPRARVLRGVDLLADAVKPTLGPSLRIRGGPKERAITTLRPSGGVAMIRVGGATEPVVKEWKDRVEDAMRAAPAAVEEGMPARSRAC